MEQNTTLKAAGLDALRSANIETPFGTFRIDLDEFDDNGNHYRVIDPDGEYSPFRVQTWGGLIEALVVRSEAG
jgi:hypothetical protein